MRHFYTSVPFLGVLAFTVACGSAHGPEVSQLGADRPFPQLVRFGPTDLLDVLSATPDNARLAPRAGVTEQHLDATFASLDGKIKLDPSQSRLALDDNFDRSLTVGQKAGFLAIQRGYQARTRERAIRLGMLPTGVLGIVPFDNRYANQGLPDIVGPIRDGGSVATTDAADGEGPIMTPQHRVGDGRWSWSLSYRWWGVRLSVNHNFLNYLCHNTDWMLSRASLPGWIKIVIRPLGCLLHAADSGADGSSISITWAGVFWYTP